MLFTFTLFCGKCYSRRYHELCNDMFNGHFMFLNILSNIEALHIDIFASTVTLIILIGSTWHCVWNGRKGSEGKRWEDKKDSFLHLDDRGEKKRKKLEGYQISLGLPFPISPLFGGNRKKSVEWKTWPTFISLST